MVGMMVEQNMSIWFLRLRFYDIARGLVHFIVGANIGDI